MGVKCTHYKLFSVQSKLVYFSQFWGMKHFLGPVCDIRPNTFFCTGELYRLEVTTRFGFRIGKRLPTNNGPTIFLPCLHSILCRFTE